MTTSTRTPTAEQAAADKPRRVGEIVSDVVGEYVAKLQQGYRNDHSIDVALLAQLRRGAGKLPQDVPELWGVTGAERLYQQRELSETDASRAEMALFVAVTLYALHQQSRSEQDMHRPGVEVGAAVRRLMYERMDKSLDRLDEPIRRRFVRAGTAATLDTLASRLREIVSLLREGSIPLDYARLARHLYRAQIPGGLVQVRQVWGRSFHSWRPPRADNKPTASDQPLTEPHGESTTDKDSE